MKRYSRNEEENLKNKNNIIIIYNYYELYILFKSGERWSVHFETQPPVENGNHSTLRHDSPWAKN